MPVHETRKEVIGGAADIYAVKDDERVIVEIKDKRARLEYIDKIRETAQKEGIRFIIVDISDIKIEEESK